MARGFRSPVPCRRASAGSPCRPRGRRRRGRPVRSGSRAPSTNRSIRSGSRPGWACAYAAFHLAEHAFERGCAVDRQLYRRRRSLVTSMRRSRRRSRRRTGAELPAAATRRAGGKHERHGDHLRRPTQRSSATLPGRRDLDDHVRRLDDTDGLVADPEAHLLDGLGSHQAHDAMRSGLDLDHCCDPVRLYARDDPREAVSCRAADRRALGAGPAALGEESRDVCRARRAAGRPRISSSSAALPTPIAGGSRR